MQEILALALVAVAGLWLLWRALKRPGGPCGRCSGCGDAPSAGGACPSASPPGKEASQGL